MRTGSVCFRESVRRRSVNEVSTDGSLVMSAVSSILSEKHVSAPEHSLSKVQYSKVYFRVDAAFGFGSMSDDKSLRRVSIRALAVRLTVGVAPHVGGKTHAIR